MKQREVKQVDEKVSAMLRDGVFHVKYNGQIRQVKQGKIIEESTMIAEEWGIKPKQVFSPISALQKEFEEERLKKRIEGRVPQLMRAPEDYFNPETGSFKPKDLANDIHSHFKMLSLMDNDDIFTYNKHEGIYERIGYKGDKLLRKVVSEWLGDMHRERYANQVIYQIRQDAMIMRKNFTVDDDLMVFQNRIYIWSKQETMEFTPEVYATSKLPIKYNPEAKCPKIMKFLNEIVKPEDVKLLLEGISYCLVPSYPFHKAFMLIGEGRNGKSTYLNLLTAFLGPDNVSSLSLQQLASKFSTARLYGKFANIYGDLPQKKIDYTGLFKQLADGSLIKAEEKFKTPFNFRSRAKLLFSCNKIPVSGDETRAWFARWIIINFPNVFMGDNCDPFLLEKLTTEEELSGLLNKAIHHRYVLERQKGFSYYKTIEEIQEMWHRMSDPVRSFVEDLIELNPEAYTSKQLLYASFVEHCRQENFPAPTMRGFTIRFKQILAGKIGETRRTVNGARQTCWQGIHLKIENPDKADKPDTPQQNLTPVKDVNHVNHPHT